MRAVKIVVIENSFDNCAHSHNRNMNDGTNRIHCGTSNSSNMSNNSSNIDKRASNNGTTGNSSQNSVAGCIGSHSWAAELAGLVASCACCSVIPVPIAPLVGFVAALLTLSFEEYLHVAVSTNWGPFFGHCGASLK